MTTSNYRKRAIIFDVETTGLIPKKHPITKQYPPFASWPHILQISFVIYDVSTWSIERVYNTYIKVAADIVIAPIITEITGITREIVDEKGIPIQDALCEFYDEYMKCDVAVAHNIDFDKEMIMLEFGRLSTIIEGRCPFYACVFNPIYNERNDVEMFCTMRRGQNRCALMVDHKPFAAKKVASPKKPEEKMDVIFIPLPITDQDLLCAEFENQCVIEESVAPPKESSLISSDLLQKKTQYKKMPKLSELYAHLFGEVPTNLHDSLIDTLVCLRCFVMMRFKVEMKKEDLYKVCGVEF
jgi:hypothetical protein